MSEHRTYNALYDAARSNGRWVEVCAQKGGLTLLRVSDKQGVRGQERIVGLVGLDVAAAKLLPLEK